MDTLLPAHRALLERWRGAMNLVGPGPIASHYADADAGLAVFEGAPPEGRWADLGTGAGFPGIVFAARFPEVQVELVDSRQKRCTFLEHVLDAAGARDGRVVVRCGRIEALAPGYDGVMARALAPPEAVMAHAVRLLRDGGRLWLLANAAPLVPPAGLSVAGRVPYQLDGSERVSWLLRRRA